MTKDELCTLVNQDPTGVGTFISEQEAKTRLNAHLERIPNPPTDVIAHVFGLDKLTDFINRIDAYNQGAPGTDNDVVGIRIYRCYKAEREYYDKNDIFIMPVTKDGKDIYQLMDEKPLGGDIILGDPRPCPNMCNPSYQL